MALITSSLDCHEAASGSAILGPSMVAVVLVAALCRVSGVSWQSPLPPPITETGCGDFMNNCHNATQRPKSLVIKGSARDGAQPGARGWGRPAKRGSQQANSPWFLVEEEMMRQKWDKLPGLEKVLSCTNWKVSHATRPDIGQAGRKELLTAEQTPCSRSTWTRPGKLNAGTTRSCPGWWARWNTVY